MQATTVIRILIVVVLQTAALAYMILDRQHMLEASRVVTLKIVPVDPQDIFRGDYVTLSYDISRLDVNALAGDDQFESGETAYVKLQKQADGLWKAIAISHNPGHEPDLISVRAQIQSTDGLNPGAASYVSVTYGVESYFVPQGTGHAIEVQARNGGLSADIAVDANGRAAIKALRRNGKPFYVEGIF